MTRSLPLLRSIAWAIASGTVLWAGPAAAGPAVGQFEVKDLESEPGRIEFQSQNAHMSGQPRRKVFEDDGEFEFDDNTVEKQRHALELEFGITHRFKSRIGIEFEKERIDDPADPESADDFDDLRLSEVGVEGVVILDPIEAQGWGYGLVAELEFPVEDGEADTLLFGPIIQWNIGRWSHNVNLYLVKFVSGERPRDEKIDFAYAAQFAYHWSESWELALEAYGTVDRLDDTGSRSEEAERFGDHDQHRVGPLLYYRFDKDTTDETRDENGVDVLIGAGFLFGLNDDTPDLTFKWTIEVEF